jgi:mortality factor 4-like protein 1
MAAAGFDAGEPVLVIHGTGIFEGRVLDVIHRALPGREPVCNYEIHYLGWKKNWDEVVPASRLLKRDKEGLERKEQVNAEIAAARKGDGAKRKSGADDTAKQASAAAARKRPAAEPAQPTSRRARGPSTDDANASLPADEAGASIEAAPAQVGERVEIRLVMPQVLKLKLVQDWEAVTREHKLVKLPASVPIAQILNEFTAAKLKRNAHDRLYAEIRQGITAYFQQVGAPANALRAVACGLATQPRGASPRLRRRRDAPRGAPRATRRALTHGCTPRCARARTPSPAQALGEALLYRYERKQFDELTSSPGCAGLPLDEVYGAEHLLRLLVKLPSFLEATVMDGDQRLVLQAKLQELLKFVQKNHAAYFGARHVQPAADYAAWWEEEGADAAAAPGARKLSAAAAAATVDAHPNPLDGAPVQAAKPA